MYEHWNPDTGLPFYVGKGSVKRARAMSPRSKYHKRAVAKIICSGKLPEVRLIFCNLDEEMAFALERSQISYWHNRGMKLVNRSIGGCGGPVGYKHSAKTRALMSKVVRKRNQDLEYRARHRAALLLGVATPQAIENRRKAFSDPVFRANKSKLTRECWADPVNRALRMARLATPECRAKLSAGGKAASATPEQRKQHSDRAKALWADPEARKKFLVKNSDPEFIAKQSERMKVRRVSPEFRALVDCPEVIARRSATLKVLYQDPKQRAKVGAAVKAARASKEARLAMSIAAKKGWARRKALLKQQQENPNASP